MVFFKKKEPPISASDIDETPQIDEPVIITETEAKPTRGEAFAKTATAAKMSGALHETAGMFKRKFGVFTDDPTLADNGRNQQILGKVHRFVGTIRGLRETAHTKYVDKRKETQAICLKHGGRLLDVASDFVEDIKKVLLK